MRTATAIVIGALGLCLASAASAQQALKIGYVDYYRVINDSVEGKKANDLLEREFDPIKKDLRAREAALEKINNEIERQKGVLSEESLREKRDTLTIKYKSYLHAKKEAQEKFSERNARLLKPMLEELQEVVKIVGERQKYSIIFENSSKEDELITMQDNIVYVSPAIDITDEVLKEFNARYKPGK